MSTTSPVTSASLIEGLEEVLADNEGETSIPINRANLVEIVAALQAQTERPRLYYLQDSRNHVGNDMLFWAMDGAGYTTDLRQAEIYTEEGAQAQHNVRTSDIPWPKDYIDSKARPAVDMQHVKRSEGLRDSGIVLAKSSGK